MKTEYRNGMLSLTWLRRNASIHLVNCIWDGDNIGSVLVNIMMNNAYIVLFARVVSM